MSIQSNGRAIAGRKSRSFALTLLALMLAILTQSGGDAVAQPAPYLQTDILPCDTSLQIACDTSQRTGKHVPHQVYAPKIPTADAKLIILFHGTYGAPSNYRKLATLLAGHGFYVINLRYVADKPIFGACPEDSLDRDPDCYRRFRSETLFGQAVTDPAGKSYDFPATEITRANSAMNRLATLMAYLVTKDTTRAQGWDRFVAVDVKAACADLKFKATYGLCGLDWSRVTAGGHSQGAGVALYLGKFYRLGGVVMLSGPQDAYSPAKAGWKLEAALMATKAAPWISEGGFATPVDRIYGFANLYDGLFPRQLVAWQSLGVPGTAQLTDGSQPDLALTSHQVVLTTVPVCDRPDASGKAHGSTGPNDCATAPATSAIWLTQFRGQ